MASTEAAAAAPRAPIERLAAERCRGPVPLSIEAGWNQIAADWRFMLGAGRGFGVRGATGQWIASALVLPLGPAISWISMVLVTKPARGQGLGTRLLQRCIAEVEATGVGGRPRCDGAGRPIYLPLGFRDVYPLSRWHSEAGQRHAVEPPPGGIAVRAATPGDLPRICALRSRAHAGLRAAASSPTCSARAPALALSPSARDGTIVGYVLGRDGHARHHVGPVVAEDEAIGLALLAQRDGRDAGRRHPRCARPRIAASRRGSRSRARPRRAASCACCAGAARPWRTPPASSPSPGPELA